MILLGKAREREREREGTGSAGAFGGSWPANVGIITHQINGSVFVGEEQEEEGLYSSIDTARSSMRSLK